MQGQLEETVHWYDLFIGSNGATFFVADWLFVSCQMFSILVVCLFMNITCRLWEFIQFDNVFAL